METKGKEPLNSPTSAQIAPFERLLRNELPAAVKQELVVLIEKEIFPMEERIRSQLPEIVRIVQRRLFQMFEENAQEREHPADSNLASNIGEHGDSSSANGYSLNDSVAWELAASDDQLAAFWPGPYNEVALSDFDPSDFTFEDPPTTSRGVSDSGYCSTQYSSNLASGSSKENNL